VKIIQKLVPKEKYNIKCPYVMKPEFIVVHNTANDATAVNEVAYMIRNNNQVSFHYAVDDKEIVQGIPENRNAWHAGDGASGKGNRKGISIEICYSKSGGKRFEEAEKLTARFIAHKLVEYNWTLDKVKKHQDFSGKYCPHRTLDLGWQRFLNMIQAELGMLKGGKEVNNPIKNPDTPSDWAKEAWEWAKREGITDGKRPKDTMTREEMVTMLYRYYKKVK
jgi:N-acetylmuramoyl-L-alanine amidase